MKKIDWKTNLFRSNQMVKSNKTPSEETKQVWKLASEVNLIKKQTQFIKENDLSETEFQAMNKRKLNIL